MCPSNRPLLQTQPELKEPGSFIGNVKRVWDVLHPRWLPPLLCRQLSSGAAWWHAGQGDAERFPPSTSCCACCPLGEQSLLSACLPAAFLFSSPFCGPIQRPKPRYFISGSEASRVELAKHDGGAAEGQLVLQPLLWQRQRAVLAACLGTVCSR